MTKHRGYYVYYGENLSKQFCRNTNEVGSFIHHILKSGGKITAVTFAY